MTENGHPSLGEFLEAPIDEVRKVAPQTLVWIAEGTRRSAALAGVPLQEEEFARWSLLQKLDCLDTVFRHGVRHVYAPYLTPSHFSEVTPSYRERLYDYVSLLVTQREVLQRIQREGWRVRLTGEDIPELRGTAERLIAATPADNGHTLWVSVVAEPGALWREVFSASARTSARTREEAVRALYGEDIPPATMLIAFGKPVVSPDQLPPLLIGKMDCYWTQRPGYRLTEHELRKMIFDHAYTRRTWRSDKTGRAEESVQHRAAWEQGPTLGLGQSLGPFWYPATFDMPPISEE